jgi:hypothetical protein
MTQIDLFPELTLETPSSHLAIRASPLVSPESKEAQRMTATSGRLLAKLLHTKDPLFAFSKMFMVTLPWVSTKCLLTWKPKITPRGRLLCQLAPSMPRTDEIESGLLHTPTATANQMAPSMRSRDAGSWWATPNTMDHLPQRSAESMDKMKQGARKGRARPSNLREQVNPDTMQMWATPRTTDAAGGARPMDEKGRRISYSSNLVFGANLSDQVRMWPTPTASQARSEGSIKQMRQKVYAGEVTREEAEAMIGGSLEPARLSAMWPTPMARDYKDTPTQTDRGLGSRDDSKLPIRVFREEEKMWPTPTANEDHAVASWNENAEDAGQSPRGQEHRGWNTEPSMGRVADGLPKGLDRFDGWEREPADIPRVATGVKDRVSRLKGLGNAIVPSIAMQIGLTIKAVRDA